MQMHEHALYGVLNAEKRLSLQPTDSAIKLACLYAHTASSASRAFLIIRRTAWRAGAAADLPTARHESGGEVVIFCLDFRVLA